MLDKSGTPQRWLDKEMAITYYAKKSVIWDLGEDLVVMRGGTNRATGEQTVLTSKSIIAVRGGSDKSSEGIYRVPSLNNENLFMRDRQICAYCGSKFSMSALTCDHVHPRKFGGKNIWTNVVTACKKCNHSKGHKILGKDTDMELLYVPYAPTYAETLILSNRNILFDQMSFLVNFVPDSRKHLFG
jgi:ribosomal protein L40E